MGPRSYSAQRDTADVAVRVFSALSALSFPPLIAKGPGLRCLSVCPGGSHRHVIAAIQDFSASLGLVELSRG
jgi:hypothetical protein